MDIINFYKDLYQENWAWIKKIIKWFVLSVFAGIAGFFVYPELFVHILKMFEDKFGPTPALDIHLSLEIFEQNLMATGIGLVGGLFLGAGSFLLVVVNGFLLGYVVASILAFGPGFWSNLGLLAGGLIPHGIFEIPAFLLASAIGLRWGVGYLKKENKGQRLKALTKATKNVLYWVPVIIIMLAIAAIIEVFISGKLAS